MGRAVGGGGVVRGCWEVGSVGFGAAVVARLEEAGTEMKQTSGGS